MFDFFYLQDGEMLIVIFFFALGTVIPRIKNFCALFIIIIDTNKMVDNFWKISALVKLFFMTLITTVLFKTRDCDNTEIITKSINVNYKD
jgi:hypothetical protein